MSKDFRQGALVWAKMKGFSIWPGEITNPDQRQPTSKNSHFVNFFGSRDYAWIPDKNIFAHTEEMLEKAKTDKSKKIQPAIQELVAKLHAQEGRKRITSLTNDQTEIQEIDRKRISKKDEEPPCSPIPLSLPKTTKASKNFNKKHNPNKSNKKVQLRLPSPLESSSKNFHPKKKIYHYIDKAKTFISQYKPLPKKIGFLGLERIDFRLIIKLLDAGHIITIWDTGFMENLHTYVKKAGGSAAVTPAEVMIQCDLIFCCVSNTNINNVVFGNFGVIDGLDRCTNKSFIQLTAIDSLTAVKIGEAITRMGSRYLEAPMIDMMHSINHITVISSGDQGTFNDCYTVFECWGKRLFYLGKLFGAPNEINLSLNKKTYQELSEKLADRCDCILHIADIMDMIRSRSASFP